MSGWIYVIQAVPQGPVKVGYSEDPNGRLVSLQHASPMSLVLVNRTEGTIDDERELHRRLRERGPTLRGEWYPPTHSVGMMLRAVFGVPMITVDPRLPCEAPQPPARGRGRPRKRSETEEGKGVRQCACGARLRPGYQFFSHRSACRSLAGTGAKIG